MFRKLCIFFLLLLLLLTGCAANVPEETPAPSDSVPAAESSAAAPVLTPAAFTDADTAAMSSYMSANRWLIAGDRMYGLDYDGALRPVLASYRLRDGRPEDFQILCEDCTPSFLALDGERLYYLCEGRLERLTLPAGTRETLLDGPLKSLQIREDTLYLVDEAGRLLRADLDAEDIETLIDGPCDYAWVMPDGILWQSEDEGCSLRMKLWGGAERRLTAAASYAPLRVGSVIWYSQRDSQGSVIASVDLDDGTVTRYETAELRGAAELLRAGADWTLRVFLAGDGWKQQLLRPGETEGALCAYSGYRLCDYVGEDLRVDAAYDPDGRLRCFVLADAQGNEVRFFGGKILD